MRAVIMAGGEGARLRPLTCLRPKPLVPLVSRPVMAYCLQLLRRHGWGRAVAALHHLAPQVIQEFGEGEEYGLELAYSVEEGPLGTAGGVRRALEAVGASPAAKAQDPVLVVSGDTLTDLDLTAFVEFHRSRQAVASLALVRVADPSPYGAVITGAGGRITRFLEKPGPGEEFSDWVNTGIYLLEPAALDAVPAGRPFDFSRDLFPLLMSRGLALFGFQSRAYWCDIGNPAQYLEAVFALLRGRVGWEPPARPAGPGLWVAADAEVSAGAELRPPLVVGAGCRVDSGARVGPLAVLGRGSRVERQARVEGSVLWPGATVGRAARVLGAILGAGAQVRDGACVCRGAVVGDGTVVGESSSVRPGVRLWPGRLVEPGAVVDRPLVWGEVARARRVPGGRSRGLVNLELGPEQAARLALAFGAMLEGEGPVALAGDAYPSSQVLQGAVRAGLEAAGREALDLGTLVAPGLRHLCRALRAAGAVHVGRDPLDAGAVRLDFLASGGTPLSRDQERRLEQAVDGDDFRRPAADRVRPGRYFPGAEAVYLRWLVGQAPEAGRMVRRRGFRVVADCDGLNLAALVAALADSLGLALGDPAGYAGDGFRGTGAGLAGYDAPGAGAAPGRQTGAGPAATEPDPRFDGPILPWPGEGPHPRLLALAGAVRERQADLGVALDPNAEGLALVDEGGRPVPDGLLFLLLCRLLAEEGGPGTAVHLPPGAPRAAEEVVARAEGRALHCPGWPPEPPQLHLWGDGLAVLVKVLAYLAARGLSLGGALSGLPPVHLSRRQVACPWHRRGQIIRRLAESGAGDGDAGAAPAEPGAGARPGAASVELGAGVRFHHRGGSAHVFPHPWGPYLRVTGEADNWEAAEELALTYAGLVERLRGEEEPPPR